MITGGNFHTEVTQTVGVTAQYRGADKSLARPTSRCILSDVRIFRLMLLLLYIYIYIYSTNIPGTGVA